MELINSGIIGQFIKLKIFSRMVIVVEIVDRSHPKPFLGGWRNVVTGAEYHDARTQTCPRDNVVYSRGRKKRSETKEEEKREWEETSDEKDFSFSQGSNVIARTEDDCAPGTTMRTTRALIASSRSAYTSVVCERASQTSCFPDIQDKLVTPRRDETRTKPEDGETEFEFTSRDDRSRHDAARTNLSRLEEEAAIKIQKCYRAYRTRMDIEALALLSRETRAPTPPKPEKIHRLRGCRASEFEIMNAVAPRKRTDFEMVGSVLERWRFYENARLERDFFGSSKLAARANALRREIEILRSIETIKARLRGEREQRRRLEYLDRIAEPEVWRASNGEILVDTLRVRRARECRDFYRLLADEKITGTARIEVLKKFREYVSEHTCDRGRDLVCLVDQEIELLAMIRDERTTESLRNRLTIGLLRLVVNFCAPVERLPRDSYNSQIPRDSYNSRIPRDFRKDAFSRICRRCGKFLTIDDLSARIVSPSCELLTTCENCRKIQPGKEAKIVYEPYEIMLEDLRIRERNLGSSDKSPAWIVDSRIIYRLVNYVWHGKSGISECDDLYRLILVRFRPDDVWSPWNNLVLTKREAALHQSMQDPCQVYARMIMKKFVIKNLQARLRFDFKTAMNFM